MWGGLVPAQEVRPESGRPVQTDRMVRDVFVKICEDQQQFQHPVPLLWIWFACPGFEVLDDRKRIRQQPFDIRALQRTPLATSAERLVGAQKRFVEKMVKAEPLARQSRGDRVCTRCPLTAPGDGGHGITTLPRGKFQGTRRRAYHSLFFPVAGTWPQKKKAGGKTAGPRKNREANYQRNTTPAETRALFCRLLAPSLNVVNRYSA